MKSVRLLLCLLYGIGLALGHWWLNQGLPDSHLYDFGYEYGNIAEGLANGRGFSDAVAPGSGPTAWMPPLLPAIYASVFRVLGCRTDAAVVACCAIKCSGLMACLYLVLGLCEQVAGRSGVWVAAALVGFDTWLDGGSFFTSLNDQWIVNLACCLAVWAVLRLRAQQTSLGWGIVVGLLPLVSPSATLGLLVGALALSRGYRPFLVALLVCSIPAGLWSIRNRLVVGRFYPVKSNFWFDFVEANEWADHGILTDSVMLLHHPYNRNPTRDLYVQLGERSFLARAGVEASRIPMRRWLENCCYRFLNCTLKLQVERDWAIAVDLDPRDYSALGPLDLAWDAGDDTGLWTSCLRDPTRVEQVLRSLPLAPSDRDRLVEDRRLAQADFEQHETGWAAFLWSYWFTLLPALASLVLLRARSSEARAGLIVYWSFLLPYVLVQHYARYQESTVFLQVVLVVASLREVALLRPPSLLRPEQYFPQPDQKA